MITFKAPLKFSDLISGEPSPAHAYTRGKETVVTLGAAGVLQLGAPVFRAKGVTGAKWAPVTDAAQLVDTNEIAFYLANVRGVCENIAAGNAGDHKVALIQMGNIILKDKAIKDALALNFSAYAEADFAKIEEMALAKQIVIEKVLA